MGESPRLKAFTCELESWPVVLVGDFNPSIFNPDWMEKFGLVSKEESKNAIVRFITPQVTSFRVGTLAIDVRADRFQVDSVDPTAMALVRDFGDRHLQGTRSNALAADGY